MNATPGVHSRPPAEKRTEEVCRAKTYDLETEVKKQVPDQAGHMLLAGAPLVISTVLTGTPIPGILITAPLLIVREARQWPSCRPWDPPLDWSFYGIGALLGLAL